MNAITRVVAALAAGPICASLISASASASISAPRSLTMEDRVAAQKAIEQVYWSHRVWPKENPGPKPPLSDVMPDAAIRAKVENGLRKANALESLWRRPITAGELQAEINRIATQTRDGATLREVFTALHDDPVLIAECLARPLLVDRVVRALYDQDERFGGADRARVNDAFIALGSVASLKTAGGTYTESTLRKDDTGAPASGDLVPADEWPSRVRELSGRLGFAAPSSAAAQLPVGRIAPLRETDTGFETVAVLSATRDEVRLATVAWDRTTFDAWWDANAARWSRDELPPIVTEGLSVPEPAASACTDDTWAPMKQDAPDARAAFVSVWTGSEMIVWGGAPGFAVSTAVMANGWRYAPATDSWTRVSSVGQPAARAQLAGVWTGTEMIVWGGRSTVLLYDDGARYNPTSDTWQPISSTNAPSARPLHTAVWTGSEMIVWGGSTSTFLNTGGRYNPSTNTWVATSVIGAPVGRYGHTAVWTGSEMVVWGGSTGNGINTGGRYNPASDSWLPTSTTGAPGARAFHAAVWTGSKMLVSSAEGTGAPISGGIYDPATDSWQLMSLAGAPTRAAYSSAVWTGSELLVFGGTAGGFAQFNAKRYNLATDTWAPMSLFNVPSARGQHTAFWTGSEMLIWGGATGQSDSALNTGGRYSPATDSWVATSIGTTPLPRKFHSSVWTGSELIVWGGTSGVSNLISGARYSPSLDTWTPTSLTLAPSNGQRQTTVWTGTRMIVWGGGTSTGGRYDPATDTWTPTSTSNAPSARTEATGVWTGSRLIVWGGNLLNTGGVYDPVADTWVATTTTGAPPGRRAHSAVWTGSKMIVFGGIGTAGSSLNTGGRYDPQTDAWTPTSTVGVPNTAGHAAVWTGSEMLVWSTTGFHYDPGTDTWKPMTNVGRPAARTSFSIPSVWTGVEMIIWGAGSSTGGRYNPTLDSWRATSLQGIPAEERLDHPLVWTGDEMIVWGGSYWTPSGARYCACATPTTYYRDLDGDGFGDPSVPAVTACAGQTPAGYTTTSGDCADADPSIYPGAPQLCDGKNNDCLDPTFPTVPANEVNADHDPARVCAGDCNDSDPSVYPNAPQLCDGKNNNCSDPSWPTVPANEADGDADGFRICANDCNDANPNVRPTATETCNGIDDNCNTQVDEDAQGADSDGDGIHNLCDNCRFVANATQLDSDNDQVGNACDNCLAIPNQNQADADSDSRGNVCDNCPVTPNATQDDGDLDRVGDVCDNCPFDFNETQGDTNHDGEGDICDTNDGLIYVFGTDDDNFTEWQAETGPASWNVYQGDLSVLRSSGIYTQAPGSNPLADRQCGVTDVFVEDLVVPGAGQVRFSLVTGVSGGVEGNLGTNSAGAPRANTNPCP